MMSPTKKNRKRRVSYTMRRQQAWYTAVSAVHLKATHGQQCTHCCSY